MVHYLSECDSSTNLSDTRTCMQSEIQKGNLEGNEEKNDINNFDFDSLQQIEEEF